MRTPLNSICRALLALIFIFLASACSRKRVPPQTAPVIVVNGEVLTAAEFGQDLAKKLKNFDALAAKDITNVKRAKETVLREFVISSLLRQHAQRHHLTVSNSEIDEEFDRVRKTYPDDLTFKAALATEGVSVSDWKNQLSRSLLEKKVFTLFQEEKSADVPSLESDAKKFYESHKTEFQRPPQIHIQQIVVPREDQAERLLRKLKAGSSFSDFAKKYSISPDGAKGGDIGYISRGVVPAFDAAFNLHEGQLSPVVKSTYGFHIMKVLDRKGATKLSYEQARDRIKRQLLGQRQQEAFDRWLEEAVKSAKIERNDLILDKVKIRTEGAQE